ncbi:MAG: metallophosphoesterase family protein [Bacteroidales bacterium]|nr:metallophosphoesterase family protein [Bacteroidales bacterium]
MKKIYILFSFFFLTLSTFCQPNESFKITHGPWLTQMSETGVTILWTTSKNAVSWVEVAPDDGTNFYGEERPRYFDTKNGRIRATSTLHKVEIRNLKPGTSYRYAIFSKELLNWENDARILYGATIANPGYARNPLSFKTFSGEDDSVNFLIFNDVHGRSQLMKDLCKVIDFKTIDMVVFNGDMASSVYSEEQLFTDFLDAAVSLFASRIPIVYVRGNHETRGPYSDFLSDYFPTSTGNIYQLLNVGKVAFLLLDCGEDKPDSDIEYSGLADFDSYREKEATWLKSVVQTKEYKNADIKLAILHMPLMSSDWHGTLHLNELFLPVLNEAGVTAMFSGHTHQYAYNKPIAGKINFPVLVNSNNGIVLCNIDNGKVKATITYSNGSKPQEIILN